MLRNGRIQKITSQLIAFHSVTINHNPKAPVYVQRYKISNNPFLLTNAAFQELTNQGGGQCTGCINNQSQEKVIHAARKIKNLISWTGT